jgi:hypothetical protein
VQWILQHRGSPKKPRRDDWRGRSYCQTREALIRCTREFAGAIEPVAIAILTALPALIEVNNFINEEAMKTGPTFSQVEPANGAGR